MLSDYGYGFEPKKTVPLKCYPVVTHIDAHFSKKTTSPCSMKLILIRFQGNPSHREWLTLAALWDLTSWASEADSAEVEVEDSLTERHAFVAQEIIERLVKHLRQNLTSDNLDLESEVKKDSKPPSSPAEDDIATVQLEERICEAMAASILCWKSSPNLITWCAKILVSFLRTGFFKALYLAYTRPRITRASGSTFKIDQTSYPSEIQPCFPHVLPHHVTFKVDILSIRANSSPMLRVVDHADYQGCLPQADRAESFLSDLGQIVSLTNSPEAKFFATLYADGEVSERVIASLLQSRMENFGWDREGEDAWSSYILLAYPTLSTYFSEAPF